MFVCLVLILAVFVVSIFYNLKNYVSSAKCPEDFTNSDEKAAALDKWLEDFYSKSPDASLGHMAEARQNYFKENNCIQAIKRFEDYMAGRVDEKTKDRIDVIINKF